MRTSAKILGLISSASAFSPMMSFGQQDTMASQAASTMNQMVQDDIVGAYLYYCEGLYDLGWGTSYSFSGSYSVSNDISFYYSDIYAYGDIYYTAVSFYYPGYSVYITYGTADYAFYYAGYPGMAYAYFWTADVAAYYNDYYGYLYYVNYYSGAYDWSGNYVNGMGDYATLSYNTYYQWGAFYGVVDLDWYGAYFGGNYYDLYYVYDNYYWIAAGATAYCYTWWWWGNETPYDNSWSGYMTGYDDSIYCDYTVSYTIDYSFNTWTYASFTLSYGEMEFDFSSYAFNDETAAYFVGETEYSWWSLTYNGWNYYAFGYTSYDIDQVGYGIMCDEYTTFAMSIDMDYGMFVYQTAYMYGAEFDVDTLLNGETGITFYTFADDILSGYY